MRALARPCEGATEQPDTATTRADARRQRCGPAQGLGALLQREDIALAVAAMPQLGRGQLRRSLSPAA